MYLIRKINIAATWPRRIYQASNISTEPMPFYRFVAVVRKYDWN